MNPAMRQPVDARQRHVAMGPLPAAQRPRDADAAYALQRALHAALEENERLVEVIDRVLREDGVTVAFGDDTGEPALQGCVVVAAPYGTGEQRSTLGVIGPSRLDYARVVPLVDCVSRIATDWVGEQ